jgi:hypothetical protein
MRRAPDTDEINLCLGYIAADQILPAVNVRFLIIIMYLTGPYTQRYQHSLLYKIPQVEEGTIYSNMPKPV